MKDEILIQRIEDVTGQHYDSPKDFETLSELIFSKTEENLYKHLLLCFSSFKAGILKIPGIKYNPK